MGSGENKTKEGGQSNSKGALLGNISSEQEQINQLKMASKLIKHVSLVLVHVPSTGKVSASKDDYLDSDLTLDKLWHHLFCRTIEVCRLLWPNI